MGHPVSAMSSFFPGLKLVCHYEIYTFVKKKESIWHIFTKDEGYLENKVFMVLPRTILNSVSGLTGFKTNFNASTLSKQPSI